MAKRYYWIKLHENFFEEVYIKAIRKLKNGDTLVIIYLKMANCCKNDNMTIPYNGYLDSFESELACVLNEEEALVKELLSALLNMGIIEKNPDGGITLLKMADCVGSECDSAQRVKRHRDNKKNSSASSTSKCNSGITDNSLQCNNNVTSKALHCNKNVTADIDKDKREIRCREDKPKSDSSYDLAAYEEQSKNKPLLYSKDTKNKNDRQTAAASM